MRMIHFTIVTVGGGQGLSRMAVSAQQDRMLSETFPAFSASVNCLPRDSVALCVFGNSRNTGVLHDLEFRQSVFLLNQVSDTDLAQLAAELQALNASVQSAAVTAPAVLNEAATISCS